MNVIVYKNYEELSEAVAEKILIQISSKPDSVFCLASGNSTELCYQILAQKIIKDSVDISKCNFVGLDEWVGIPPTNSGSCHYFFNKHLFEPLSVDSSQIIVFDGMSNNLEEECKKMDAIIKQKGGIDFMIVGVGMNGHIGFNEPGVSVDYYSHVIQLDEVTQSVGQKYFDSPTKLQNGITLGLKYFLEAKKAVMMANGAKKAEIIKKTLEGKVDVSIPSTIIQKHQNALVAVDEEAYGKSSID